MGWRGWKQMARHLDEMALEMIDGDFGKNMGNPG